MNLESFFKSKLFKWLLLTIAYLIVILLIFNLGVFVGFKKAKYSYRWGENYHQMFGGPRGGFMQDFQGKDFTAGHGTVGQVIKVEDKSIIVSGPDQVEKIIKLTDQTEIRQGREIIKTDQIKTGDLIVAIGSPNDDGTIEAKLIRRFDPQTDQLPPPRPEFVPFPEF
jgi:hypothetical protein